MKDAWWDRLALGLALIAVVTTSWTALTVFEGIPHLEDEFANVWQANVMANGALALPTPEHPKSFLVPFVVDHEGLRFGKYPPGWPATLSLGVRAGALWLVNPLLAGVAVWLTYRLAARLLPSGLAFLSALLLASSPMLWMLSGSLMSHNLGLSLTLAFSLAWLNLFRSRAEKSGVRPEILTATAGASLGLLGLTRPLTAVGVGLPFAIDGAVRFVRERSSRGRLLAVAAIALALLSLLPLWNAALTGDPLQNPYTFWWDYDRVGFGPGHGNVEGGHSLRLAYLNTIFSLQIGQYDAFGWLHLSWLFLPVGALLLLRRRQGRLVMAVFPALVGVYAAYWIGAWLLGPRYYYEGLPGVAIATAAGVGWLGGWLSGQRPRRWRRLGMTAVVGFLLATNFLFYLPTRVGGLRGLYGIDKAAMAPLANSDLEHALIIVQADHWSGYANLRLLTPPFTDRDLRVAWSRSPGPDGRLRRTYADYEVFYHDPAHPAVLLRIVER